MTKTKTRTQTGGWDWPWTKKETMPPGASPDAPSDAPEGFVEQIQDKAAEITDKIQQNIGYNQSAGSRRRRRRCTKKHRHSSACKRKSKGRKSYRKRR